MKRRRFTVGSALLLAGLMAVPIATLDAAVTARAAGAATFTVPALVPSPAVPPGTPDQTTGFDTGYSVSGNITLSASGSWCTHTTPAPAICNGPNGTSTFAIGTKSFLYPVETTAFALVGRIGTTGAWTLVGSGPITLSGNGELYLAQNDERGQFGDNSGSLTVTYQALSIPQLNPPVSPTITSDQRAAWTVPISNISNAPLTGVTATFKASSGSTPLSFDGSLMTGCAAGAGNSEVCSLPDIPANTSVDFSAFAHANALSNGKTIGGIVTVAAAGETTVAGFLGTITVVACGAGCVISVGAPGAPVASSPGPPTDLQPTKQIVSFPNNAKGAPPVAITLQSINPGPKLSNADKLLCPPQTPCSGQISVVGGDFRKYTDKAHPLKIQIIAKWKTAVPPGRILMAKPGNPPIQLPLCVKKAGKYNTPCQLADVVRGSAATHNLLTITTILFIAADPRMARHVSTGPDVPTAVKATAGKKKATVTWKAPVVTNGRIVKYTVTPHLGKVAKPSVSFAGNLLKGVISGLTSGKSYTFTVVAGTATGVSLASKASNVVKVT